MTLLNWLDILGAAIGVGLLVHWLIERSRLRRFVNSLALPTSSSAALALDMASQISNHWTLGPEIPYLSRFLAPVGSSASALISQGGCCSGVARLFMLCLAERGIRANQITVYSSLGEHCLVEVHMSEGQALMDPMYGVYYTDGDGRHLSLDDLQAGVQVEIRPIPRALKTGYDVDEYYNFDFSQTKTANWKLSWLHRLAYRILNRVTSGAVDRFRVPQVFEWPQTLLGVGVAAALVAAHLVAPLSGVAIAALR